MDSIFGNASAFNYDDQRTWNVWRGGEVVGDYKESQMRKFDPKLGRSSNEPAFWDDGSPKMQITVTVRSEERNPGEDGDDGLRQLYIPIASKTKAGSKFCELIAALKRTGAPGPRIGGRLYEMLRGTEPGQGNQPRKIWAYYYEPPAQDPGRQMDQAMSQPAAPPAPVQNGNGQGQYNPSYQQGPRPPAPNYTQAPPAGPPAPPQSQPQPVYAQSGPPAPPAQQQDQQHYVSPPAPPQPGHNPYQQ